MVFRLLKARWRHGWQAIPDPVSAPVSPMYRGFPEISSQGEVTPEMVSSCPSGALSAKPISIDLGKCHFCGACSRIAGSPIRFSNRHLLAQTRRESLVVAAGTSFEEYRRRFERGPEKIRSILGRSLKIRSVSAGGCNACEMELSATTNPNFDMVRYGIDIVASPRHADAIVITGPISANMAVALEETWNATPSPKVLILMGTCAISGGVFSSSPALDRRFLEKVTPHLYIPGCPPHPLAVTNAILDYLGRRE